jgi:hypothetical protein
MGLRGLGETDSRKKPEVKNLVALSLFLTELIKKNIFYQNCAINIDGQENQF